MSLKNEKAIAVFFDNKLPKILFQTNTCVHGRDDLAGWSIISRGRGHRRERRYFYREPVENGVAVETKGLFPQKEGVFPWKN
jgi:hypothetical protein